MDPRLQSPAGAPDSADAAYWRERALAAETAAHVAVTEIRHRMANAFQVLAAVVRMRADRVTSEEARTQLEWVRRVSLGVGLLNQHLSAYEGGSAFDGFLSELAEHWRPLLDEQGVRLALRTEPLSLPEERAAAVALSVQELITNCCEHAFQGGGGEIRVSFLSLDPDWAELTVADDGIGMGEQDQAAAGSLGLSLVGRMARQIGGQFEIGSGARGAVARMMVPLS